MPGKVLNDAEKQAALNMETAWRYVEWANRHGLKKWQWRDGVYGAEWDRYHDHMAADRIFCPVVFTLVLQGVHSFLGGFRFVFARGSIFF